MNEGFNNLYLIAPPIKALFLKNTLFFKNKTSQLLKNKTPPEPFIALFSEN